MEGEGIYKPLRGWILWEALYNNYKTDRPGEPSSRAEQTVRSTSPATSHHYVVLLSLGYPWAELSGGDSLVSVRDISPLRGLNCLLVVFGRSCRLLSPWFGFATSHHYVVLLSLGSLVLGTICRMGGAASRQLGVAWRVGCRGVDWPCWCLLFRYGVGRGFVK